MNLTKSNSWGQTRKEYAIDNNYGTGLLLIGTNRWISISFAKTYEICFLSCYLHNKNNPIRVETGDSPNIGENPLCTNIPADSASNILRYFECNTAIKWYGMHVIFKTVYPNSDNHILIREFLIYGNEKDVSKKNDFL